MQIQQEIEDEIKLINPENEFSHPKKWYRQIFGMELLMLLYGFVDVMELVVLRQYIFHRVQLDLNITNIGLSSIVCSNNSNYTNKSLGDEVQHISLNYVIKISLAFQISALLTAPIYIVFSKQFSRKQLLVNVGFGLFIKSVTVCFVIYYNWSLLIFIGIDGVYGLTGGAALVIAICFSFIANTFSEKARTRRIVILVLANAIGCVIASFTSGYFIKRFGFLLPFLSATIISFGCFTYPLTFIRDLNFKTKGEENFKDLNTVLYFIKKMFSRKNICSLLTIIFIMYGLFYVGENAGGELTSYVLLSYPICMNPVQFGDSLTIAILAVNFGLILTGTLLNAYLDDLVIIMICLLSGISFNMQMAFASTVTAVFIAFGTNIFSASGGPFIKGYLSKQINDQNQTGLFIGLTFIETVLSCISRIIIMLFYQETLKHHRGLVYVIFACITQAAILLAIILTILRRKQPVEDNGETS